MKSATAVVSEFQRWNGLATTLGTRVPDFDGQSIPRRYRRSMSRVAQLAVSSVQDALTEAGLDEAAIGTERTGVAFGSTMGGTSAIEHYYRGLVTTGSLSQGVYSTTFLQIMSHTCAANVALTFGIPGRVLAPCTACAASTQAIGFA